MDISAWLRELGLERYEQAFQEGEIDLDVLADLTDADLRELGIPLGPRKKLLKAISALAAGTELTSAREARRPEPERRQLTVMFVDLVGSTELAARLDPEDMGRVIRAYQECCTKVVRRWDGYVAKYMGDGVLAYFGWPQAHEDDAERAVRAGLELVETIGRQTVSDETRLATRVGIATGLVLVGELIGDGAAKEQAVVGETPNLAARLQALAAPGSVAISQATRRLVGGLFALSDLGRRRLKGFAEPLAAWRVEGEGRAEGRFEALRGEHLTPLVGREHELGILLERWAWAKEGEGQVVLLSGEPGIGKSRLIRTLRERLGDEPCTPLSHYCSPYHTNSALHPVIGLLERAARLDRDDPPETQLAKLEAMLARSSDQLEKVVPLLAALLGVPTGERYPALILPPEVQKWRTLQVLVDQLAGLAARQPVLALYEDAHWIDPSTLELVGLVLERIRKLPVLVLITSRPEFQPPWTGQAHVTTLTMSRLSRRQGAELVARITGDKALPAEVVEQIVARTDGVPLFVEELTKTVLESGLLADTGDRYELSGPLPPLAIPTTLHDSLMARLDRLAPIKEVAQTGAVIGREFSYELLAAVVPLGDDELQDALAQLVESELIFRRGVPPDATYAFKHALVQDAAYQSLLRSRRQQLHAAITEVLEARTDDTPPEVVARHCTEAGLTDKAVGYWRLAGRRASELSAYQEAIAHLGRAQELLLTLPTSSERDGRELDLQLALGAAWISAKAYGAAEVRRAYETAVRLSRRVGNADQRFAALRGLWNNNSSRVELTASRKLAVKLKAAADESGDPEHQMVAERAVGTGLMALGEHREANACFQRAMTLYDPERHQHYVQRYGEDSGFWCYVYAAWTDDWLGRRDRALNETRRAIEIACELPTSITAVIALATAATVHQFRRELEPTLACAEEAIRIADQLGVVQFHTWASIHRGWALACAGRTEEGRAEIEAGLATWRAIGGLNHCTHILNLLAEACHLAGKPEAGATALDEAEDISRRVDLHTHDVETCRWRGELQLALGHPADAEASWLRAIEVARAQGTKTFELRAATNLAGLWLDQDRHTEARDLLAPAYDWFTEGFDTADLKDARVLLDQLC